MISEELDEGLDAVLEVTGLARMRCDITNLYPSFCMLNRTLSNPVLLTYRSDHNVFRRLGKGLWIRTRVTAQDEGY